MMIMDIRMLRSEPKHKVKNKWGLMTKGGHEQRYSHVTMSMFIAVSRPLIPDRSFLITGPVYKLQFKISQDF